ncbi:MAG TPA: hypothetical protein DD706_17870 [Nitrospiraceae bacterium]|nr:hypothetical protein [Nitrospiraceae bacterium]
MRTCPGPGSGLGISRARKGLLETSASCSRIMAFIIHSYAEKIPFHAPDIRRTHESLVKTFSGCLSEPMAKNLCVGDVPSCQAISFDLVLQSSPPWSFPILVVRNSSGSFFRRIQPALKNHWTTVSLN